MPQHQSICRTNLTRARIIIAIVALIPIAGILTSCAAPLSNDSNDSQPISVQVIPAVRGSIGNPSVYAAKVQAKDQVDVTPLSTGRIQQLNVDIGTEVQEGELIAELSHGALDAELQQAQAALRKAEADLARLRLEIGPKHTSAQSLIDAARARLERLINPSSLDLQAAATSVDKAQADLEAAKTELEQLENPSKAELSAAQAAVAEAESKLSLAQVAVNRAINDELQSNGLGNRQLWELLLSTRVSLQADIAKLQNLQASYDLTLGDFEMASAQKRVAQTQTTIDSILELIADSQVIPEKINQPMWAETAAQKSLDDAQANLQELQDPEQYTLDLARYRVNAAQATLDAAVADLELLNNPSPADLADAEAEVAAAEQALALSQDDHVHYDLAAAQAVVDQAQAQVDRAKHQLLETQIRAPFNGFVIRRWVSSGAVVSTQTPIVTIASKDIVVSVQVEESSINYLQQQQVVNFTTPAIPNEQLKLRVSRMSPGGNEQAHTFSVQLSPVEIPTGLKPGMSGEVSIEAPGMEAVLVPGKALLYQQGKASVFVAEDGRASLREVTPGKESRDSLEITSGLQPGELVVVTGWEYLADGDRLVIGSVPTVPPSTSGE